MNFEIQRKGTMNVNGLKKGLCGKFLLVLTVLMLFTGLSAAATCKITSETPEKVEVGDTFKFSGKVQVEDSGVLGFFNPPELEAIKIDRQADMGWITVKSKDSGENFCAGTECSIEGALGGEVSSPGKVTYRVQGLQDGDWVPDNKESCRTTVRFTSGKEGDEGLSRSIVFDLPGSVNVGVGSVAVAAEVEGSDLYGDFKLKYYRQRDSGSSYHPSYSPDFTEVASKSYCSGSSCRVSGSFTPGSAGTYVFKAVYSEGGETVSDTATVQVKETKDSSPEEDGGESDGGSEDSEDSGGSGKDLKLTDVGIDNQVVRPGEKVTFSAMAENTGVDSIYPFIHWRINKWSIGRSYDGALKSYDGPQRYEKTFTYDEIVNHYDDVDLMFDTWYTVSAASSTGVEAEGPQIKFRKAEDDGSETVTDASIGSVWASPDRVSKGGEVELNADISTEGIVGGFDVKFYSGSSLLATYPVDQSSGYQGSSTDFTASETVSWSKLERKTGTGTKDLTVKVVERSTGSALASKTKTELFTVEKEEQDTEEVRINSVTVSESRLGKEGSTKITTDIETAGKEPDFKLFIGGKQVAFERKVSDGEITKFFNQQQLLDEGLQKGKSYKVEAKLYTPAEIKQREADKQLTLVESSDTGRKFSISDLSSGKSSVASSDAVKFSVDIEAFKQVDNWQVDFFVDGKRVEQSVNPLPYLGEGESEEASVYVNWEQLKDMGLETGANHDLRVEVTGDGTTKELSQRDAFYLEEESRPEVGAEFVVSPDPAFVGEQVNFTASGSYSSEGGIDEYRWSIEGVQDSVYGEEITHTFEEPGYYTVELKVSSGEVSDSYEDTLRVKPRPETCNLEVTDFSVPETVSGGEKADVSVKVENTGGERETVDVEFDSVGGESSEHGEIAPGDAETFTASLEHIRNGYISVDVVDRSGECGTVSRSGYVRVLAGDGDGDEDNDDEEDDGSTGNLRPSASFSYSPSQPETGDSVSFDASASNDQDGRVVEYSWYFGDGSTANGKTPVHSFTPGSYNVQLVVEDNEGKTSSTTRTVNVGEEPAVCGIDAGSLKLQNSFIESGSSTEASFKIYNTGEPQKVKASISLDLEEVKSRTFTLGSGETRTFKASVSPLRTGLVTSELKTIGPPCGGKTFQSSQTVRTYPGDTGEKPDKTGLRVKVRNSDGRRINDARITAEGPEGTVTRYTTGGEKFFDLGEGSYTLEVYKDGYNSEERTVQVSGLETVTVYLDRVESSTGSFKAVVKDGEGERLEDAEVEVDGETRETGIDGETFFRLEPGTYSVKASKQDYGSRHSQVEIREGKRTRKVFRLYRSGPEIKEVSHTGTICRGGVLKANVKVENTGSSSEYITLKGEGLNSQDSKSFSLEADGTVSKTLYFTNVQGDGEEEFTVSIEQTGEKVTETVDVNSCLTQAGKASQISMSVSYPVQNQKAVVGDMVKVSGYVDGVKGKTTVDIKIGGEVKASTTTDPGGYFQTWVTATEVGSHVIKAETKGAQDSRPINVVPTAQVTGIEAPVKVFEAQEFQVCAQVSSQVTPEVVLIRDGEVLTTRKESGKVCFQRKARQPGLHEYKIAALTSGPGDASSTTVEVLKMMEEASSFPGQIASVESGSGMVKVELYNNNSQQKTYNARLKGLPSTWISQSEKKTILNPGEKETIYFYLTPQEEGSYRPDIQVTAEGETVYTEKLDVITGGTKKPQTEKTFFQAVVQGLSSFFR
ncbi:MAG: PKD domain-containing protein [Candidatus Nanohalobium sp.]